MPRARLRHHAGRVRELRAAHPEHVHTHVRGDSVGARQAVREQFKLEPARGTDQVRWNALDAAVQAMIWARFNDSVGLIERAGKLGACTLCGLGRAVPLTPAVLFAWMSFRPCVAGWVGARTAVQG